MQKTKSIKRILAVVLALCMVLGLAACGSSNNNNASNSGNTGNNADNNENGSNTSNTENTDGPAEPDKNYVIRIYSNSNAPDQTKWLTEQANKAGFKISIDDNTVISGDTQAIQKAVDNKDGDILFGLNETRWSQLINGSYEGLSIADWTPSWADKVGDFKYDGKAYGLVIQNVLMLYRTDEAGTDGEELHFDHWSDIVNSGYTWYRQGKVGGTTNANINSSILYPYTDPESPAGGISVDGWKTLWKYCANGKYTGDSYGFEALNRGDVQISTYFSSELHRSLEAASEHSEDPLTEENLKIMDIADGTYYIAEYLGVLNREERTEAETLQVLAFAEWFGGAELQAAWAAEFNTYPCNKDAAEKIYSEVPDIYKIKNFALNTVEGTEMTYAEYVGEHSFEWTNILINLGYYWQEEAPEEPDWDNINWEEMVQRKAD